MPLRQRFPAAVITPPIQALRARFTRVRAAIDNGAATPRPSRSSPQALQLPREVLGERHPDTITSLNNLAGVYDRQGRYAEAEPLYPQALQLRREVLGERHPDTISSLNNLARVYHRQGRSAEAEPLLPQALQLSRERCWAKTTRRPSRSTGTWPICLAQQGRMAEALIELRRMAPQRLSRLGRELLMAPPTRLCGMVC